MLAETGTCTDSHISNDPSPPAAPAAAPAAASHSPDPDLQRRRSEGADRLRQSIISSGLADVQQRLSLLTSDAEEAARMIEAPSQHLSVLSWAAMLGNSEILSFLLARPGVNPDVPDGNGATPFFWAAQVRHRGCGWVNQDMPFLLT